MKVLVMLAAMLGSGLLTRHVARHAGRTLATRTRLRVPVLCAYATAGCTAGLLKLALTSWTSLAEIGVWVLFGSVWGLIAGTLLPLSRRV